MRTITIELRVDDRDKEKIKIVVEAAMSSAKHLYTTAVLISDQRPPQISLYTGDNFTSAEEILLSDDIPADEGG